MRGQRSPGSVAERPTAVGGAAAAAAAVWKARCGSCAREVPRSERCGTPAPQHGRCREWGEARKRRSAPLWSRSHPPSLRPLPACCRKFLNWRWQTSLQARRCNSNPRRSLVNPLTRSRTPGLLYVYLEGWGCEGTSLKPLEMRVLAPAAQHPRTQRAPPKSPQTGGPRSYTLQAARPLFEAYLEGWCWHGNRGRRTRSKDRRAGGVGST